MKRLRKDRRRNPLPFSTVFIISFTIFLVLTVLGLIFVEYGIRPTLMTIAKTETQRIAAQSINDAVSKRIVNELDIDELVLLDKNGKGNLTSIRFDPQIYNRVTAEATTRVQRSLESINEGSIAEFLMTWKMKMRDYSLYPSGYGR
ncbi:hypothetical protein [Thalassobacillus sp. C254]|uniref:hypothetical protein n=1 Tax=Thalassobacillus sp. C254 TaxID=1225341 RepID=UPI0006D086FE|nr:hypothetical protein [Thalassobacillus sp. C254]